MTRHRQEAWRLYLWNARAPARRRVCPCVCACVAWCVLSCECLSVLRGVCCACVCMCLQYFMCACSCVCVQCRLCDLNVYRIRGRLSSVRCGGRHPVVLPEDWGLSRLRFTIYTQRKTALTIHDLRPLRRSRGEVATKVRGTLGSNRLTCPTRHTHRAQTTEADGHQTC